MGAMKTIIMIVVILFAINYFAPETYDKGREWVVDKVKQEAKDYLIEKINSTDEIKDLNITFDYNILIDGVEFIMPNGCSTDQDCVDNIRIGGLECTTNKTCKLVI